MISFLFVCFCIFLNIFIWIKSGFAMNAHLKILNAIDSYSDESRNYTEANRLLCRMESYFKTLFRFWDFGYKHILPKEDFELIKPYLGAKRNAN